MEKKIRDGSTRGRKPFKKSEKEGEELFPPNNNTTKMVSRGKEYKVRGKKPRPRSPESIAKQTSALQLRMTGATYAQIAQAFQVTNRAAREYVKNALDYLAIEPAEELLKLELSRLDSMQAMLWRDLLNAADADERIRLVDAIMRIMDRRARYLNIGQGGPTTQVNIQNNVKASGGVLIIQGEEPEYLSTLESATGTRTPELDFVEMIKEEPGRVLEGQVVEAEK